MTIWNFHKNILDLMKPFENLNYPYYHELKFSRKWESFAELIWWTALLSWAVIFAQKDSFDDVTWNFELALLSWAGIFAKLRKFSMMSLKNLNCPYYHELNFLQKYPRWSHLKLCTARISTNWNFRKNKEVLLI